ILTENLATTEVSSTFLLTLKQTQKTIYQARKLENNIAYTQKINDHILNRQNNFSTNTTKMIDSVLQRHIDPVIIHNITKHNDIITEPNEIKEEIRKHFKSWTKSNLLNYNYWTE